MTHIIATNQVDHMNMGSSDEKMLISALAGNDVVRTGAHNDRINGGDGDDRVYGRDGDDRLKGGAGKDVLVGGDGDDVIYGGAGRDRINGGEGDDVLIADDAGRDFLTGGEGGDKFVFLSDDPVIKFEASTGTKIIRDFEDGIDLIDLKSFDIDFNDLSFEDNGKRTIVTIDGVDDLRIAVMRVDESALDASDFIF